MSGAVPLVSHTPPSNAWFVIHCGDAQHHPPVAVSSYCQFIQTGAYQAIRDIVSSNLSWILWISFHLHVETRLRAILLTIFILKNLYFYVMCLCQAFINSCWSLVNFFCYPSHCSFHLPVSCILLLSHLFCVPLLCLAVHMLIQLTRERWENLYKILVE